MKIGVDLSSENTETVSSQNWIQYNFPGLTWKRLLGWFTNLVILAGEGPNWLFTLINYKFFES